MKELKALDILKEIKKDKNFCNNCNGLDYCNNTNPLKICGMRFDIDEAIAELESLQAPKTCEGCKYSLIGGIHNNNSNMCMFCARQVPDYYEPKDQ